MAESDPPTPPPRALFPRKGSDIITAAHHGDGGVSDPTCPAVIRKPSIGGVNVVQLHLPMRIYC